MLMAKSRIWDALWFAAFGLASSVLCVSAAAELGATFDEPFYLDAGLESWRTGSNKKLMSAGTMPLPVDVQTLPIYLWEQIRGREFHPYQDIDTILPVARAANLAFWWTMLAYAMRLGRTWGGTWGGRLAVAFVALEPNFLGHAALATTDIALVAAMLALVYHFHHGRGMGWGRRIAMPGLLYGVAILVKVSGMIFGLQAMLVIGLCHLAGTGALSSPGSTLRGRVAHLWHTTFGLRKDLVWIGAIGLTITFAYTGSDWGTEPTFTDWAERQPEGRLRSVAEPLSRNLTIFPNAGEAILQQVKHNMRGHGAYLLGTWHDRAHWSYFPVALAVKTPAPILALLLAVMIMRPRSLLTPLIGIVLVLFAFSLNCRVQIGVRFMFTLMTLFDIALATAVARMWMQPDRGRFVPKWFVAAMLCAMAGVSVWIWPHGISFMNQLWGGVDGGYVHLSDSNYDWGQGLPELKKWNEANNTGQPLAITYFGTDPAILFPPFKSVNLYWQLETGSPEELRTLAGTRYLAVSTSVLHGHESRKTGHMTALLRLRSMKPIGRTQTFLIYDLGE
jgi:hypothetical protein